VWRQRDKLFHNGWYTFPYLLDLQWILYQLSWMRLIFWFQFMHNCGLSNFIQLSAFGRHSFTVHSKGFRILCWQRNIFSYRVTTERGQVAAMYRSNVWSEQIHTRLRSISYVVIRVRLSWCEAKNLVGVGSEKWRNHFKGISICNSKENGTNITRVYRSINEIWAAKKYS